MTNDFHELAIPVLTGSTVGVVQFAEGNITIIYLAQILGMNNIVFI